MVGWKKDDEMDVEKMVQSQQGGRFLAFVNVGNGVRLCTIRIDMIESSLELRMRRALPGEIVRRSSMIVCWKRIREARVACKPLFHLTENVSSRARLVPPCLCGILANGDVGAG